MFRKILAAKIHRATVTQANVDYEGSIALSPKLLEVTGLMPYEAVQVWNVSSGTRFETYAIANAEDTEEICINGAAAHLAKPGDLIIIARFIWLEEEKCTSFKPTVVFVDEKNRIKTINSTEHKLQALKQ